MSDGFFFANSKGCARDGGGTQGRIGSCPFFRGGGMFSFAWVLCQGNGHKHGKKTGNSDRTTRQAVWLFLLRGIVAGKKRQNNRRPEKSEAGQNHDRHG